MSWLLFCMGRYFAVGHRQSRLKLVIVVRDVLREADQLTNRCEDILEQGSHDVVKLSIINSDSWVAVAKTRLHLEEP